MNARVLRRVPHLVPWSLTLLCAAALLVLYPMGARTQSKALPSTYVVKPGDTIASIAQDIRPPEATVNQMGLALARANMAAFRPKSEVRLPAGTQLTVPTMATILATDAATAEIEFGRLVRAEEHYKAGLLLEKSNNMFHAFNSYVEAAKLGHGLAQLRLGQLYDNDFSGFVERDLQESVRWYQKARTTGVQVAKPATRAPGKMQQ